MTAATANASTPEKRRPLICDACGAEESEAVQLVERNGRMLCEPHAAEEDLDNAQLEELGRTIGLLLKDRYKYHQADLIANIELFAGLDNGVMIGLMQGKTLRQIEYERDQALCLETEGDS